MPYAADFLAGARRAAEEIPNVELILLKSQADLVLDGVLRTLRANN